MSRDSIDYLDLRINLSPKQHQLIKQTIQKFEDHYDHIKVSPKLRDEYLLINSYDLISFLGYLDMDSWSEIDLQRLKSEAKFKMQDLMNKAIHANYRAHYQWSLTALESFEWGRYLKESDHE
jgi:hypothetical protein